MRAVLSCYPTIAQAHKRLPITTVSLDPILLVWQRGVLTTISSTITRWIGCLARSSCTCREVWSAAAMLPHQPCSHPACVMPFTPLATGMLCVLVTIMESVSNVCCIPRTPYRAYVAPLNPPVVVDPTSSSLCGFSRMEMTCSMCCSVPSGGHVVTCDMMA